MANKRQKLTSEHTFELRSLCEEFFEQGWELLDGVELDFEVKETQLSIDRSVNSEIDFFRYFITDELVQILVSDINDNLNIGNHQNKKQRNDKKPINVDLFLQFYGVFILMENTFGNTVRDVRDHYRSLKKEYGPFKNLGMNRFQSILSSFFCPSSTLSKVCELLRSSSQKAVVSLKVSTIDETVIGYQPTTIVKERNDKAGEPIPVVYIPRKPHPNGLLIYTVATYVKGLTENQKLPYVLDLIPHMQVGDVSPTIAFKQALENWIIPDKPIFVADNAFGTSDMCQTIENWGGRYVLSFKSDHEGHLWSLLSYNGSDGQVRYATNTSRSNVASTRMMIKEGKLYYQNVVSNAPMKQIGRGNASISSIDDVTPPPPVSDESPSIVTKVRDDDLESDTSEERVPHPIATSNSTNQRTLPNFTETTLSSYSVKELRQICKSFNIKMGPRKSLLVQNILVRTATVHRNTSQVDQIMSRVLASCSTRKDTPLHDLYGKYFNLVDLVDRRWNEVEEKHIHHQWQGKLLIAILRFATINSWTLSFSSKRKKV